MSAQGGKPLFKADCRCVKEVPVADIEAVAHPWMIACFDKRQQGGRLFFKDVFNRNGAADRLG